MSQLSTHALSSKFTLQYLLCRMDWTAFLLYIECGINFVNREWCRDITGPGQAPAFSFSCSYSMVCLWGMCLGTPHGLLPQLHICLPSMTLQHCLDPVTTFEWPSQCGHQAVQISCPEWCSPPFLCTCLMHLHPRGLFPTCLAPMDEL